MGISFWQLLIVLVIVLVLFGGRGKISQLMGDFGKGIRSFKSGMAEGEDVKKELAEEDPKATATATVTPKTQAKDETTA